MYTVFTRLGDGEFLFIASRDEVEEAVQLAEELNESWPREYVVRDSIGNDVPLNEYPAIQVEPEFVSPVTDQLFLGRRDRGQVP